MHASRTSDRHDNPRRGPRSAEESIGQTVGVDAGTTAARVLVAQPNVRVQNFSSELHALQSLCAGCIDAVVKDLPLL
ncbi:type 2 periplasmic-binding domain-containing protein [Rubidibacter lacunae]|uniref:transporter substrate-binding domain-containing protein n=1 Tax=Rubidibacter lacunae TaxID=582514 RepID=UPI000429F88C|nr:transporter substrate-binding domain-containing protein [Rubidibacter lacunae]